MGEDFKKETKFIFRSLLALGLLESSNRPLTKDEILIKIGKPIDAEYRSQVNRIIEHIKDWLPDGDKHLVKISENDGREKEYSFDFELLKRKEYIGFLDVLLTLNEIWIRDADEAVNDLYEKEGDGPLGIVTKLMVAIKGKNNLSVIYKNIDPQLRFKPKTIFKSNNKWLVNGIIQNTDEIQLPLEISKILKIE
jgi:hypothetical protein